MTYQPNFSFHCHHSANEFTVPKWLYLTAHSDATFTLIATSVLVLHSEVSSSPRVLLLQRARDDDDPNKWEPPGGACDDDDESILHAAARELWEEAGLRATWFYGSIGEPHRFTLDDGRKVAQFNFVVKVEAGELAASSLRVRLNPEEHQRFVWATEDEVIASKVGGIELDFTRGEVKRTVLQAFERLKNKE